MSAGDIAAMVGTTLELSNVISQNSSKPANVRCTLISRVSIASSPAPRHSARMLSIREASALGGVSESMPIARNSSRSGCCGKPPPNMSQA